MTTLVLLTNVFPYARWEPYLEREAEFYGAFDHVHIFSLGLRRAHLSSVRHLSAPNVTVHPILMGSKWAYAAYAIRALGSRVFLREIAELARRRGLSVSRILDALIFVSRAHREAAVIGRKLELRELDGSEIVFYAYRYAYQPLVASLLARDLPGARLIARAHGLDLYQERHPSKYLPLRTFNYSSLDRIYPVSLDGRQYILDQNGGDAQRVQVRYLGTEDRGIGPVVDGDRRPFRLISCSHVVDVKRLDRLVDALAQVSYNVHWTHIGAGELFEKLAERAAQRLGSNIEYEFLGTVPNEEILQKYSREPFHLFVNVSESEGVPVSIMEAMSFGIPTLATDVGGTAEIVAHRETGFLLKPMATPREIAEGICMFIEASNEEYSSYRVESRRQWAQKFDSKRNYQEFVEEVVSLIKL